MPDPEQELDPMAAQFMAMLKSMPDDALGQIYELIEAELTERGWFEDEPAGDDASG